jgi:hypothetical protein
MATHGRRLKQFSYRDQVGASLEAHTEHWRTFTWQGGPWIVAAIGPWGCCKVWASSGAEGKRVIRHAAAIAGFDPDGSEGTWIVTRDSSGRSDTVRSFQTRRLKYGVAVTKRPGPNGFPEHVDLAAPHE